MWKAVVDTRQRTVNCYAVYCYLSCIFIIRFSHTLARYFSKKSLIFLRFSEPAIVFLLWFLLGVGVYVLWSCIRFLEGGKGRTKERLNTGFSPRGIGFSSWRCSSELAGAPSLFRRGLSLCGVHLFWHILVFPLRQTEKSTTASCHRALFFWVYGVGPPMYGMLYSNPAGSGITPP